MLSSAVVHLTPTHFRTTVASVRIAKTLADILQCGIIDKPGLALNEHEVVFIVNSPSAFCVFIDDLVEVCKKAKRIVWVMNDYKIYPPTQLRRYLYENNRKLELWGTLPKIPDRFARLKAYGNLPREATHILNWNALTYQPLPMPDTLRTGLIYWGAFRHEESRRYEGRRDYFKKYLNAEYVNISTTKKAALKFKELCPLATIMEPLDPLIPEIQRWASTVYLEDNFSHEVFCQPANRFYEALSAGIAILVEQNASNTLKKAGFDQNSDLGRVADVQHVADLMRAPEELRNIAICQREIWATKDFRADLLTEVKALLIKEGLL